MTQLEGRQKVVSGIALPSGYDKLYTVSKYETLRIWDLFQRVGWNLRLCFKTLVLALAIDIYIDIGIVIDCFELILD